MRDVKFALRLLMRSPFYAGVVVLTLGLGIGANTAIFSVVQAVLLKPLPYAKTDSLAMIWSSWSNEEKSWVGPAEYADYLDQLTTVESIGVWTSAVANLTGAGEPERVQGASINAACLDVLGVAPILGRDFEPEDDVPGQLTSVIIGHDLWQRRFNGDPSVIGREIQLDGFALTVLGVMPPGFRLPTDYGVSNPAEFFVTLGIDPASVDRTYRGNHNLNCVVRLKDGVAAPQLSRELDAIFERWTNEEGLYPPDAQMTAYAVPVREEIVGDVRSAMLVLLAASALLLLIACVNVANLLLARGDSRHRELAIRAALGGSRVRLLRQLLTESVLLALSGGGVGLLLASFATDALMALEPGRVPRVQGSEIDGGVLLFTLAASIVTGIIFGLVPALKAARGDVVGSLKDGATASGLSGGRHRFQGSLVVTQLALAVLLLSGAGLMVRSFHQLTSVDPGFATNARLTFRLNVPQTSYPQTSDVVALYDRVLDEVRTTPGVTAAGAVSRLPMDGEIGDWDFQIEGRALVPGRHPVGDWKVATEGYFEAMGVPLVAGRYFKSADTAGSRLVAIVNESLASKYWPDESPVGKRIRMLGSNDRPWVTIVGVVGDVKHAGLDGSVRATYYRPHSQLAASTGFTMRSMSVVAESAVAADGLIEPIRRRIAAIDGQLPLARVRTMEQIVEESVAGPEFTTLLLGVFAMVALSLAAVGIYGVISYAVSLRTQEMGVRIALGAQGRDVLRLVLGGGLKLIAAGVGLGIVAAMLGTRALASQLFEVSPLDPAVLIAVSAMLIVVALLACFVPAWRAMRVDPMRALRHE